MERQASGQSLPPEIVMEDGVADAILSGNGAMLGLPPIDTGFARLDRALGGLRSGLYVLSGVPSMGKTAFAKQLADGVAERGTAVLYVSYLQSARELRRQTLSRLSNGAVREPMREAAERGSMGVLGQRLQRDTEERERTVDPLRPAAAQYRQLGRYLAVVEAGDDTVPTRIRELGEALRIQRGSERFLVVIDHVQAMPTGTALDHGPENERINVLAYALRRLARDLDCPVLAVWAESRETYRITARPSLAVFKGAEAIVYAADVIIALWENGDETRNLGGPQRSMELHILKNRTGPLTTIPAQFDPAAAAFTEQDRMTDAPDRARILGDQR